MRVILVLSILVLTGCAKNVILTPTGGSKSDGIIEMSYSLGSFENPIIDEQESLNQAINRCKKWGYNDAEPFGGALRYCSLPSGLGGCQQQTITYKYQCLD